MAQKPKTLVIFIILSFLLFSSACSSTALVQDSVPEDVKQEMIYRALSALSANFGNTRPAVAKSTLLEITGSGKPLPVEVNSGVEEVVCYKVHIDYTRKDTDAKITYHGLAKRTGNLWVVVTAYENSWKTHSCPGDFDM